MLRGGWLGLIIALGVLLDDSKEYLRKRGSVLDWVLSRCGYND